MDPPATLLLVFRAGLTFGVPSIVHCHCFLQDRVQTKLFVLIMLYFGSLFGFQLLAFFPPDFPFIIPSLALVSLRRFAFCLRFAWTFPATSAEHFLAFAFLATTF
jgi:hypothetical protein